MGVYVIKPKNYENVFCEKPGAKFLKGCKVTLLCYWGDYFKRLQNIPNKNHVMDILAKNCPSLVRVLSCKGDVKFAHFKNAKYNGSGFVMQQDADFCQGLIPVLGNNELQSSALTLLNTSLKVFWEIHDHCPLKGWVDGLNEL